MSNSLRLKKIREVFDELGLSDSILSRVWELNKTSNDLAYHGFQHLLTVSLRAVEGGRHYGLSKDSLQALAIAGLMHDVHYKLGESEKVNIPAAQNATKELFETDFALRVNRLIAATEFPHKSVRELDEKIIQDADLMQNLEDDRDVFLKGLASELGSSSTVDPLFPGLKGYNTDWAKNVYRLKLLK